MFKKVLKIVHLKQFEQYFIILKELYFLHGLFQKVLEMLKIVHLKQFEQFYIIFKNHIFFMDCSKKVLKIVHLKQFQQFFIILKEPYFLHGMFKKVLKMLKIVNLSSWVVFCNFEENYIFFMDCSKKCWKCS